MVRRWREKSVHLDVGTALEEDEGFDALDLPDMPGDRAGNVLEVPQALRAEEGQYEEQLRGGTPAQDKAVT